MSRAATRTPLLVGFTVAHLVACVPEARLFRADAGPRGASRVEPDSDVLGGADSGANSELRDAGVGDTSVGVPVVDVWSGPDTGAVPPGDATYTPEPAVVDAGYSGIDAGLDEPEPPVAVWTGSWGGLTSQGRVIRFSLFEGAVLSVAFDWLVPTDTCNATGGVATTFASPFVVEGGEPFSVGPLPAGDVAYTLSGSFATSGLAAGELNLSHPVPGCSGSAQLTWSAAPIACGNGQIEWPETCDDGNDAPRDGCSELCQVLALAEGEPNDTPDTVGSVHEADVVLTGSLAPGSDVDVFAVRNPHPGPIAVSFETHGQALGTCRVDTFLQILDESGQVLAEDDDGARAWFCSALSFPLDAAETVFVRVSSTLQDPIDAYAVAVNFQEE